MKYYIAEIVATGIAFACALTSHAGACAVWRILKPLDNWAYGVMHPTEAVSSGCECHHRITMMNYGQVRTGSWRYCPTHHRWAKIA